MANYYDHFSGHAAVYAAARPDYPPELFDYLASLCPVRNLALDCATGSGQAARALVQHFDRVIAIDASEKQLAQAPQHDRIEYRLTTAEAADLGAESVNLVTVAQALHWFDLDTFYPAMRKQASEHAVIAIWCYGVHSVNPEIDSVIARLYQQVLGPYWPPQRMHVESGYRDLPFPFQQIKVPTFTMAKQWSLAQLLAYLDSWSATQKFRLEKKYNPVEIVMDELETAWGGQATHSVVWPLHVKAGHLR